MDKFTEFEYWVLVNGTISNVIGGMSFVMGMIMIYIMCSRKCNKYEPQVKEGSADLYAAGSRPLSPKSSEWRRERTMIEDEPAGEENHLFPKVDLMTAAYRLEEPIVARTDEADLQYDLKEVDHHHVVNMNHRDERITPVIKLYRAYNYNAQTLRQDKDIVFGRD